MPSSLSAGPTLRTRLKSRVVSGLVGYASPELVLDLSYPTAPGAIGGWVWTAPRACKLVRVDQVNSILGAGGSKIFVRKHVAGQSAAPAAATSGTAIVDMITNGLAADATINVSVLNPQLTVANTTMATNDKLALITPATWAGLVSLYVVWL
jgi:hypothetical protein